MALLFLDDRAAFVSALAASNVIYIPSGSYLIASEITLHKTIKFNCR